MASKPESRKRGRWLVAGAVLVLLVVVVAPYVYFHFIQGPAPAKLSLDTTPVPSAATTGTRKPLAGTWKITSDSLVRYRVKEEVFGQSGTAVGKTKSVTGSMTIAGTSVTDADFTVDMTTFESDESRRDGQFQNRIMNTSAFPTSTFTLTSPIELAPVPADGVQKAYMATGKLLLHGTTKTVTLTLNARRTGNAITVQGDTPITFSDYGINNPSGGPASVGDSGTLEFVLQLAPS